jgi:hypothetical protein
MIEKTVAELSAALAAGETTSVALTQAYLDQIAAHNETLNAYITVCADSALAQARAADEAQRGRPRRSLASLSRTKIFSVPKALRQQAAQKFCIILSRPTTRQLWNACRLQVR